MIFCGKIKEIFTVTLNVDDFGIFFLRIKCQIFVFFTERLLKMDMEDLVEVLQKSLEKDFGYNDDQVIEALQSSMEELRKAKMHVPPKPKENEILKELPTKPFGLFVPPSVEQVIGRRTLESKQDLIRGKRTSSIMRPVIPPDGGPALVPPVEEKRNSQISFNSRGSASLDYSLDGTATSDGLGSRVSGMDYQSSRTSNWDSDVGSVGTSQSRRTPVQYVSNDTIIQPEGSRLRKSRSPSKSPSAKSPTSPARGNPGSSVKEFESLTRQINDISAAAVNDVTVIENSPVRENNNKRGTPTSRSQTSVYDNVNSMYENDLENTLESLDASDHYPVKYTDHNVTVVEINDSHNYRDAPVNNHSNKTSPDSHSAKQQKILRVDQASYIDPGQYRKPQKSGSSSKVNSHKMYEYSSTSTQQHVTRVISPTKKIPGPSSSSSSPTKRVVSPNHTSQNGYSEMVVVQRGVRKATKSPAVSPTRVVQSHML